MKCQGLHVYLVMCINLYGNNLLHQNWSVAFRSICSKSGQNLWFLIGLADPEFMLLIQTVLNIQLHYPCPAGI